MFFIAKEVIIFPAFVPLINIILELFVYNSIKIILITYLKLVMIRVKNVLFKQAT